MTPLLLAAIAAPDGWIEAEAPRGVLSDDRHALLMRHANGAEILLDRRGPTLALHLPAGPELLIATWDDTDLLDPEPVPQRTGWRPAGTLDAEGPAADPATVGALLYAQAGPPAWEGLRAVQALLGGQFPQALRWVRSTDTVWDAAHRTPLAVLAGRAALAPLIDAAGWRVFTQQGALVRPDRLRLQPDASAHERARTRAAAAVVAARYPDFLPSWWPR